MQVHQVRIVVRAIQVRPVRYRPAIAVRHIHRRAIAVAALPCRAATVQVRIRVPAARNLPAHPAAVFRVRVPVPANHPAAPAAANPVPAAAPANPVPAAVPAPANPVPAAVPAPAPRHR